MSKSIKQLWLHLIDCSCANRRTHWETGVPQPTPRASWYLDLFHFAQGKVCIGRMKPGPSVERGRDISFLNSWTWAWAHRIWLCWGSNLQDSIVKRKRTIRCQNKSVKIRAMVCFLGFILYGNFLFFGQCMSDILYLSCSHFIHRSMGGYPHSLDEEIGV